MQSRIFTEFPLTRDLLYKYKYSMNLYTCPTSHTNQRCDYWVLQVILAFVISELSAPEGRTNKKKPSQNKTAYRRFVRRGREQIKLGMDLKKN